MQESKLCRKSERHIANICVTSWLHFREARVPTYHQDEYWHHIATTWSSKTGDWKIYLDGLMVSIMYGVASGITIPKVGTLLLGEGNFYYKITCI
jgi:hypothetical protein